MEGRSVAAVAFCWGTGTKAHKLGAEWEGWGSSRLGGGTVALLSSAASQGGGGARRQVRMRHPTWTNKGMDGPSEVAVSGIPPTPPGGPPDPG